ncbi:MAG TPA: hypothetical protein PLV68_15235, partial [Ilumatobacteraceae bacterium]|nr:hypothetical protein [Ilumatobacteraceae bacterium]
MMTTIDELADNWLVGYPPRTATSYRTAYRRWLTWCVCNDLAPLTVTRVDIQRWIASLTDEGLKPRTVTSYATAIAGLYRSAYLDGHIDRDPAAHMRRPRTPTRS